MLTRITPAIDREAIVWIDHSQAIITTIDDGGGVSRVERLDRGTSELESAFGARAIHELGEHDRVVVTGPVFARTTFERAFVAATHRPDRLVDLEPDADAADAGDLPGRWLVR